MGTESRTALEARQLSLTPPPPPTVMVVDDEPRVGLLFEKILSEEGYRVVTATSGRRALALAAAAPPDLILLDIVMPDLDGLATLRQLRRQLKSAADPDLAALRRRIAALEIAAERRVHYRLAAQRAAVTGAQAARLAAAQANLALYLADEARSPEAGVLSRALASLIRRAEH